jgi:head-tail adaptor
MRAGALTERVAFDAPSGGTDAFGGTTEAYTEHHVCAAQWIYGRGNESVQAAREAGRKAFKVRVRSSAATRAVTTDYRLRDTRRGTTWNITEADAITDRQWVHLVVEGPVS